MKKSLLFSFWLLIASFALMEFLSMSNDISRALVYYNVGWFALLGIVASAGITFTELCELHEHFNKERARRI